MVSIHLSDATLKHVTDVGNIIALTYYVPLNFSWIILADQQWSDLLKFFIDVRAREFIRKFTRNRQWVFAHSPIRAAQLRPGRKENQPPGKL